MPREEFGERLAVLWRDYRMPAALSFTATVNCHAALAYLTNFNAET